VTLRGGARWFKLNPDWFVEDWFVEDWFVEDWFVNWCIT
jgi:hypothetical protein